MNVLVVDVGGTSVKLLVTGAAEPRKFESDGLTPAFLVDRIRDATADWRYDVASIGYPGRVSTEGPVKDPGKLGPGWVGYDFEAALGVPVRVVNDAVLQALGGYDGGRMLFLGLGTGLGSAIVTEHVVVPMELGELPIQSGDRLGDAVGVKGLEERGHRAWLDLVTQAVAYLRSALIADYILLGGGNASLVDPLPPYTRRGGNDDAFEGGFRLWEEVVEPHDRKPAVGWRVVR